MELVVNLLCVLLVAIPVLSSIAKDTGHTCSLTEFSCSDGACISAELVCDGHVDCADASDETACQPSVTVHSEPGLNRSKRQATCRKNQWKCRDGTCITFDGKCDGLLDCPDGSDETHALCRKTQCQSNWFRCTYGACVDGTAPCNGLQECADNSDELLPRCRNETEEIRGRFKCQDGSFISAENHCDGTKDCADGSDETVRACAGKTCPSYLFQCAYGACVDSGADCNKIQECADGSDESEELCGKTTPSVIRPTSGNCVLPPYPEHGTYVTNIVGAQPGLGYKYVTLEVSCQRGYGVLGSSSISCQNGVWRESIPKCVRQCKLDPHPSVEYRCIVSGVITGTRACNAYEPAGTTVIPECRKPNYYSPTTLTFMRCVDGYWDYTARCTPGLIKKGTNITILIKDTVEVYNSEFQYLVPLFNQNQTVGVTSNSGFTGFNYLIPLFNKSQSASFDNQNQTTEASNSLSNVVTDNSYFGQVIPITDGNGSTVNNNFNNIDDSDFDIDPRMGESTNKVKDGNIDTDKHGNIYFNVPNKSSGQGNTYFNITNSTVFINTSDEIVYRGY